MSDQASHHWAVWSIAKEPSIGRGTSSFDRNHDSTKGARCPSRMVKSATVVMSLPWVCTGVQSARPSGPAMAECTPSTLRTQGTTEPYSKRMTRSMCISTAPFVHSTTRTIWGCLSLTGMQSTTRTVPSGSSNSVSSTRELPR